MSAENVVLRHAVSRKHLTRDDALELKRRRAAKGATRDTAEFLAVLATVVSVDSLSELTVIYEEALSSRESPGSPVSGAERRIERAPDVAQRAPAATGDPERTRRPIAKRALAAASILGAALALTIGIWIGTELWTASGEDAVRTQIVALLATPAGEELPDARELLPRVASLRGRTEAPLLRDLLSSGPADVRLNAASLLALLGDVAAGPALQQLAEDPDELARLVALDCLGRLRGRPPLAELERALYSERTELRHYAIGSLEQSGEARAVDLLRRFEDHPHARTRTAVLRALLALDPTAFDVLVRRDLVARELVTRRTTEPAAVEPARQERTGADAIVDDRESPAAPPPAKTQVDVARAEPRRVGESKEPSGADPEAVKRTPTKPKPTAARPPPKKKPQPKPPSPVDIAKRDAPTLLAEGKLEEARALLDRVIEKAKPDAELHRLRGLAHLALGALDAAIAEIHRAIDLAPDLSRAYFDLSVCYAAKKQKRNSYEALVMSLRFGFRDIAAIRVEPRLEELKKTEPFRRLMEHYFHSPLAAEEDDEKRRRLAFKRFQTAFRGEKDPFVRAHEAIRFPEPGGIEATSFLSDFLRDRSFIVRHALAEVLGRARDPESIAFLCGEARNLRSAAQPREALMWTLRTVPGSSAVDALLAGLAAREFEVQLAAATALGDRPDRRAVGGMIALLERGKPLERLTVAEALGKITGKDLGLEAVDWRNWWEAHGGDLEIGPVRDPCVGAAGTTVIVPPAFSERTGDARKRALARHGGTRGTELAVEKALEWLSRHQNADGRWDTDEWALRCAERKPWERVTRVRQRIWDNQVTAVALMAFLGAGYTHKQGTYHDTVRRGLEFLKKRQVASGYFSGDHYHSHRSHEIATIAITEAYLMTRDCELRPVARRGIEYILRTQHETGGWGWHPRESHTSFTGWNLLAMMTASQAGFDIPASSLVSLRHFLDRVTIEENGPQHKAGFAFELLRPAAQVGETLSVDEQEEIRTGGGNLSTTVGLWCRVFLGQRGQDPRVQGALAEMRRSAPRHRDNVKFSAGEWFFFATQAALLEGGTVWKDWNKGMQEALLGSVVTEDCERGSWAPESDFGRVYSTAVGALVLESYYRFHLRPKI